MAERGIASRWVQVGTRVPPEFHRLVRVRLAQEGITLSELLRIALVEWYGEDKIPPELLAELRRGGEEA